ncbi:hypothetical protein [Marispirochaeta sp.]|uniref:PAS domain-containing protein n=1 Tax=Marispirochaeta sp. TaxID=2038653 RepID=UPI0029C900DF|nr:hypothetical protein [Marispirochaeta sp.]
MDLKRSRSFLLLLILGSLGILSVGISAYLLITGDSAEGLVNPVFTAERILFISIIACIIYLTAWGAIAFRGVSVEKRLDRLIQQSRYRRLNRDTDFAGFGSLGRRLQGLYNSLTDANSKLSRKVAAQGTLLDIIISNSPAQMLITDSTGNIVFISRSLLEVLKQEKQEILQKSVENVWKKIQFNDLRAGMEETFSPVDLKAEGYPLTAYPVSGSDGLISYVVFNAEKRPFLYNQNVQETKKKEISLQNRLMGMFRRGKKESQ